MNYSKHLRIKPKRLLITLAIVFGIGVFIGFAFTSLVYIFTSPKAEAIEAVQTINNGSVKFPEEKLISLGEYRITAYCSCEKCCGKWAKNRTNGIIKGASGIELKEGVSIASSLPFGTRLIINGLGEYIVQDRTSNWISKKYRNKIIDIYFNNHEDAKKFGVQYKEIIMKGVDING
jgi:3D (Asp-Asp-Asp) domain-containing protein